MRRRAPILPLPAFVLAACSLAACTPDGASGTDVAPDWSQDSGLETDDTGNTDSNESGETGETDDPTIEPTWAFEDGTTGIRFDLVYDGTVGAEDVVRIGLFTSATRGGGPAQKVDVVAIFPKSVEVSIEVADFPPPGGVDYDAAAYVAAYIDRNNDHYHYPGPEDLVLIYGPGEGVSWGIPVYRNMLTTGATLTFKDPF